MDVLGRRGRNWDLGRRKRNFQTGKKPLLSVALVRGRLFIAPAVSDSGEGKVRIKKKGEGGHEGEPGQRSLVSSPSHRAAERVICLPLKLTKVCRKNREGVKYNLVRGEEGPLQT